MFSRAANQFWACINRASGVLSLPARSPAASGLSDLLFGEALPAAGRLADPAWLKLTPSPHFFSSVPDRDPRQGPDLGSSHASTPSRPHDESAATPTPTPLHTEEGSSAAVSASAADPSSPPSPSSSPPPSSPSGPASRRDKGAPVDTIYPSSHDDNLGVQRNWFNALYSQLNAVHRTGMVPHMKGRQQEVFVAVEREFEALWERHVRGKGLEDTAHRGMLLCCLAIATHKVLRYESGDDELVREVVRTNLGGMAVGVLMRLHKARLWLLLRLLAEDPYKEAVRLLPSFQSDLGSLLDSEVSAGEQEAVWTIRSCGFYQVLAAEDATELLPEFCCHFSMQWLECFSEYGVRVGLEQGLAFGDECCSVRISRRQAAAPPSDAKPPSAADGQQASGGAHSSPGQEREQGQGQQQEPRQ